MTRKKLSLCTLIAIGLAPLASMNLANAQDAMPTNDYWWPNQLDLQPLRMHSPESDPMGDDFDYAEAFSSLDLDAVKQDLVDSDDYLTGLVASRLRSLWSVLYSYGLAQCRYLPYQ